MENCWKNIKSGRDLPNENQENRIFAHQLAFIEAMSESVFQLCLSCLILREFGLSKSPFTKFIQLSSLVTSALAITHEFAKRQSFLEHNFVPGFFSWNNFRGFIYWILPLFIYIASIYVVSFSQESFGNLIFLTILLLHPAVSIPMAFLAKTYLKIMDKILKEFGCHLLDHQFTTGNFFQKWLRNFLTFSTIPYLACTTLTQCFLFDRWIEQRQILQLNGYVYLKPRNDFTNKDWNICVDTANESEKKINILNFLTEIESETKSWLLFGCVIFMIVYHALESAISEFVATSQSKPLLTFLLGKPRSMNQENQDHELQPIDVQGDITITNNEENNSLIETNGNQNCIRPVNEDSTLSVRQSTQDHAVSMSNLPMTILLTNGLAIVYIVLIYSSSLGFHHFMEGSQKYTLVNKSWSCSTHKILECSFPFRHNYTVHYGCLNDQWCATKVLMDSTDEESNVMSIDFCENDCPGMCKGRKGKCNNFGTKGCNETSYGKYCMCKNGYNKNNCGTCGDFFYPFDGIDGYVDENGNGVSCKECNCDQRGSLSCDRNGTCICYPKVIGTRCDRCSDGCYDFPMCKDCNCHKKGSLSETCNQSGQCQCKHQFDGDKCAECSNGYFNFPSCNTCNCNPYGAFNITCNDKGKCHCLDKFTGDKCDVCESGFYNFPHCKECACDTSGSETNECDENGRCYECRPGFHGTKCDMCAMYYFGFPNCEKCNCNISGSVGQDCDGEGRCKCKADIVGEKCDECSPELYDFPNCKKCDCYLWGSEDNVCDEDGQCKCKVGFYDVKCNSCNHKSDSLFCKERLPPKKLVVKLTGKAYNILRSAHEQSSINISGVYQIQIGKINDRPYWIHENQEFAIWWIETLWMFGLNKDKYLGSREGSGLGGPCYDEDWPQTNGEGWTHVKVEDGEETWMNVTIGDLTIQNLNKEDHLPPKTLLVTVSGKTFKKLVERYRNFEKNINGNYHIQSNKTNGFPYWVHEDKIYAIWKVKHKWAIGKLKEVGSTKGVLAGPCKDESDWPRSSGKTWEWPSGFTDDDKPIWQDIESGEFNINYLE